MIGVNMLLSGIMKIAFLIVSQIKSDRNGIMWMADSSPLSIIHAGLDESGALSADTPLFTMAVVVTPRPDALQNLIRRAALRSGKRQKRLRKVASELKWRNASQRIRSDVLKRLALAELELFTLTVRKEGRRIKDTPENYAILVSEILRLCWDTYPNVALSLDRHFTSPVQIATVDTFIHRQWPTRGVLSINHVDSQRNTLVQLADFVAGSVYSWHKKQDAAYQLIEDKVRATLIRDWRYIKAEWIREEK
jgi:hypothetical protein